MKYIPLLLLFFACTPQPQQAIQQGGLTLTIDGKKYTASGNLTLSPINGEPIEPPQDTVVVPPIPGPSNPKTAPRSPQYAIGINARPYEPIEQIPDIDLLRLYVLAGWINQPGGLATDPLHQAETEYTHGLIEYFERAKRLDKDVLLTVFGTPEWYKNTGRGDGNNETWPIKPGTDPTNPNSYKDYAQFIWQIAARFGSTKHADYLMRVDQTPRWNGDVINQKKSGLGHVKFLEFWNEPDKWWKKGLEDYFEPEATAAMMSACFDGHCSTMGNGVGVMSADPSMVVVMPGLTDFDLAYFARMNAWFVANRRDKKWPCHVLNFHHYSNISNQYGKHPPTWTNSGGTTPANDKNFPLFQEVMKQAKILGLPVWLTETGLDQNAPSPMAFAGNEEQRGQALVETCQAWLDAGAERVFLYVLGDEPSFASGGLYTSSGLLSSQSTGYKPKPTAAKVQNYIKALAAKSQAPAPGINRSKPINIPLR